MVVKIIAKKNGSNNLSMIDKINRLQKESIKRNHRRHLYKIPIDIIYVIREYWQQGKYMLINFGWKSFYTFWFTKLFVGSEGGEYELMRPLFRNFPGILRRPFKIEIEHTTVCNKKCLFCAHTHRNEKQEQMTFDDFKYIIDSIDSLKWINIAGIGSNYINKDFYKMIKYAREKHINVNFVDEFDFFDEKKARNVIELGINSICVSFDAATKTTYENIKKGCNFDKALNNIKTLLKLKEELNSPFPEVHFRFLVTRINYQEMPDYITLIGNLKNRGIRSIIEFIGLIVFPGIEKYYMPFNEIDKCIILKIYENAIRYNVNLRFSHAESVLPPIDFCTKWAEPFILVNGEVIPDCAILMQSRRELLNHYSFGNIFHKPFMDIWNSKNYKDFRKIVNNKRGKVPLACSGCCAFSAHNRIKTYGIWNMGCC